MEQEFKYNADNIDGLKFKAKNVEQDFLYTITTNEHDIVVSWVDNYKRDKSTNYSLGRVLMFLNSGDWIVTP